MAYDPTIDETRWASVRRQWLVWQHDAELRAQLCRTERLREPLLTRVFNKLHSLDELWEIACDYRADRERVDAKSEAVETVPAKTLVSNRRRGRRAEKFEEAKNAMLGALRRGQVTPDQLNKKKQKELETYGNFSRETLEEARRAALSEFVGNSNSDK